MKKLKIRTKIMLLYTLLSAVLLSFIIPTVYSTVANSLKQTLQAKLQLTLSQVLSSVEIKNGNAALDLEKMNLEDGVYLVIKDTDGTLLYESKNAVWLSNYQISQGNYTITVNGDNWAVKSQQSEINEKEIFMVAATSMNYVNESLSDLILLLLLLIPVYIGASALGSFLLAKRAMRPIRQITQTAMAIGTGDLSNRIQGIESKDEVGELASTFNNMLDQLDVSFQRERQFTSDASHELRTPITVISACTEDALSERHSADTEENLKMIKNESQKMTKIISQLLMLSRGYEGRYHFEPDQITLSDMIDSVSDELNEIATEKMITVHNDVNISVQITADQSLMTQLFVNLIENGIKYGKNGGNIWVNAVLTDQIIQISVSDDGIGISVGDQKYIFDRFYRADKARDRSGFGLGLAIVKWIVELHNGTIAVKSSLGHGTTFVVSIPQ